MLEQATQFTLAIYAGPQADQQDSADLTRRLRQQLLDADIDRVEFARSGSAPDGSKGDAVSLASLAVSMAPLALTSLTGILQAWLTRHERASVTVESGGEKLTLTGSLSHQQQQTLAEFLNRHKPSPA